MVEPTQNGLAERLPGAAVVDGARPEKQHGGDGVRGARQGSLRGPARRMRATPVISAAGTVAAWSRPRSVGFIGSTRPAVRFTGAAAG